METDNSSLLKGTSFSPSSKRNSVMQLRRSTHTTSWTSVECFTTTSILLGALVSHSRLPQRRAGKSAITVTFFSNGSNLNVCVCNFSENFVRLMLENKMIDINKEDEDGVNAFWIAARCGHGDTMRVLAEHGINIYNTDRKNGNNALHLAARFENRHNILDMLVRSKYDLNRQNHMGDSAMHIAGQKGNFRQLETLIQAGADMNIMN